MRRPKTWRNLAWTIAQVPQERSGLLFPYASPSGKAEGSADLNYTAVLFEPEAEVFLSLRKRYAASSSPLRGRVTLFNTALLKAANVLEYRVFPAALESTLMKERRQYDPTPDYTYQVAGADARIVCDQQKDYIQHDLCGANASFTVLSIDAEGADRLIFSRIHEVGCSFDLVIIEAAGDIVEFMKVMGYIDVFHSGYNVIFRRAKWPLDLRFHFSKLGWMPTQE